MEEIVESYSVDDFRKRNDAVLNKRQADRQKLAIVRERIQERLERRRLSK